MKDETRVNHPPAIELPDDNHPLNLPIFQNVKWETDTVRESERIARGARPGFFYSRLSNPSVRQLELMLAQLQRRDDCMVTASGVNAVAQTLVALTKAGDHVVFFTEGYGPTRQIIRGLLARFGVTRCFPSTTSRGSSGRSQRVKPDSSGLKARPTPSIKSRISVRSLVWRGRTVR
jgi:cystathionine beta-lyase/cystathionine gamma-synthase